MLMNKQVLISLCAFLSTTYTQALGIPGNDITQYFFETLMRHTPAQCKKLEQKPDYLVKADTKINTTTIVISEQGTTCATVRYGKHCDVQSSAPTVRIYMLTVGLLYRRQGLVTALVQFVRAQSPFTICKKIT